MVYIINGEVVQDNDPRVRAKYPQAQSQPVTTHRRSSVTSMSSFHPNSSSTGATQTQEESRVSNSPGIAQSCGLDGTVTIPGFCGVPSRRIQKTYLAAGVVLTLIFGWPVLVIMGVGYCLTA